MNIFLADDEMPLKLILNTSTDWLINLDLSQLT